MAYPQVVMVFSFLAFLASIIPLPWHLEGLSSYGSLHCRKLTRHPIFRSLEHRYLSVHVVDGARQP